MSATKFDFILIFKIKIDKTVKTFREVRLNESRIAKSNEDLPQSQQEVE